MRIFVSYTMRDGVLDAMALSRIERRLAVIGKPYIDLLHNNSPDPQQHVMQMLRQSAVLCVCLTPASYASEWFQLEVKTAAQQGKPIIELKFMDGDTDSVNWQTVRRSIFKIGHGQIYQ